VFDLFPAGGFFADSSFFSVAGPSKVTGDTNSGGIVWSAALLTNGVNYSKFDTNPDNGFTFTGLSTGAYTLTLIGTGAGFSGYGGSFTVSAVPEPSTYALLLAGIGMVGFVASRRRA
jgi:hypothetical protein